MLPCRGGSDILQRLFSPLGYTIEAEPLALDDRFPEWGESPYSQVTLTGTVSNRLAHDRAIERVRLVRGVRAIVDRLEVAPIPRPDYELEFAVAGALIGGAPGALVGTIIGAGVMTTNILVQTPPAVKVPKDSMLTLSLTEPMSITPVPQTN